MKPYITSCMLFLVAIAANSQNFITKAQAIEDLHVYDTILTDVHYNPFLFVEKETYYSAVDKIKATLPDSIDTKDFMKVLYRITSMMEDSHSAPSMFQADLFGKDYKKEQFFPIHTIIHDNKLYVSPQSEFPTGIAPGSEIISINSVDVTSFLKETQASLGGLPKYKEEFTRRLLSHFLFLSGVKAPFEITYKDPTGKTSQKETIEGITYVKSLLVTMPGLVTGNSFKIIDDKVGYIDFCAMNGSFETFGQFIDSALVAFKEKNIKHLAVDLRHNSGGNSTLGDVLLSFITDKKYKLMGHRKWKVSQQYKDYLLANGNSQHGYLEQPNGKIWNRGDCEPQQNNFTSETMFEGDVYFLTGPFTFSSGNMIASGVKEYEMGTIIGQPTGENTNDFGEVYSFTLPNSKIVMNITTSMDVGPECDESKLSPVIPDVPIENDMKDMLEGEDKVIQYILDKAN